MKIECAEPVEGRKLGDIECAEPAEGRELVFQRKNPNLNVLRTIIICCLIGLMQIEVGIYVDRISRRLSSKPRPCNEVC